MLLRRVVPHNQRHYHPQSPWIRSPSGSVDILGRRLRRFNVQIIKTVARVRRRRSLEERETWIQNISRRRISGLRKFSLVALSAVLAGTAILGADWPTQSGSPQRNGWARSEDTFTKANVGGLDLLYKYQADNQARGLSSLTSPLIDGMLITYLGFKEMLVFGGSSDNVYSVDADLNRLIWKRHLDYHGSKPQSKTATAVCPGGLTATVMMPGSSSAARSFTRKPKPAAGAGHISALLASGFGRLGAFFAVGSDGYLHLLNTSTGQDLMPPIKFLPANAKVSSLNFEDNRVYAATLDNCGGNANALYAIDLENQKVFSFTTNGSGVAGMAGTAIGTDGTVYAQIPNGNSKQTGTFNDTVVALDPKDLSVKDYFTPSAAAPNQGTEMASATPVVFSWKGKDVIVAGGKDGRLYWLDSTSLGGPDHHKPLYQTEPIASADPNGRGHGFRGAFSSWEDAETGTRWIYASLSGPPGASTKFSAINGTASKGSIAGFKVEEKNGQPTLTPAWISRDMMSPAPAATANGLVFALSTGESSSPTKENGKLYSVSEREKMARHATLYVLDGATGKELYSSGDAVTSYSHGSGLAVANGRVYFTTHDNTAYCFGFLKLQPQLTEQ
jgi:outer membrane protein assembly factor BamB